MLPRVDAVAWVTRPREVRRRGAPRRYLRRWTRRLDRQAFVLNKVDRVSPADADALRADIRARLAALGDGDMPILAIRTNAPTRTSRIAPQNVWQEDRYPWLRDEKDAIRRFVVDMRRPFFGICLGHQLLADALGGSVQPADFPNAACIACRRPKKARAIRSCAN